MCLYHRSMGIVGREHDPINTDLKQEVEERGHEVETADRIVNVLSEVGAHRALQFRHFRRHIAIDSGKHEGKRFAEVADYKLQARIPVECPAEDNADHMDCGFEVPSPTRHSQHVRYPHREVSGVERFDYLLSR